MRRPGEILIDRYLGTKASKPVRWSQRAWPWVCNRQAEPKGLLMDERCIPPSTLAWPNPYPDRCHTQHIDTTLYVTHSDQALTMGVHRHKLGILQQVDAPLAGTIAPASVFDRQPSAPIR